jgi:putative ABC transport system permease protein
VWLLTARDLQYRAVRFGLAILGTALLFAMVMLVGGVAASFMNSASRTVDGINAGTWIVPEGTTGAFTTFTAFDARVADQVGSSGEVSPLVVVRGVVKTPAEANLDIVVVGRDADGLGAPVLSSGRDAVADGEAVVASAADLPLGTRFDLADRTFEVVGIADGMTMFAGTPLVFVGLDEARTIAFEGQPVATTVITDGEVGEVPAGYVALTATEVADDALRLIEDAVGSIDIVNILLWIVAASVIGAVIYLSALERLRDFAVLKAVGTSSRSLLFGLAVQATIVAVVAAVIAMGLQALLVPLFPLTVEVPPATFVRLPIVAVIVGLVASLGGLRRAVRVDPAAAFSGPGG